MDECGGVVVAGGHVGVLLRTMRVFALDKILKTPLIAWSAGAMALAERVILYHDMAPQGPGDAEVYAEGLGAYRGVLPFPHAKRRLRLSDDDHVGLMARRFEPWRCLLLADGVRVDLVDGAPLPAGARTMDPAGGISDGGHSMSVASRTASAGSTGKSPTRRRKLAINRLRERAPLDDAAIHRFLARHELPIVEGVAVHVRGLGRGRCGLPAASGGRAAGGPSAAPDRRHRSLVRRGRDPA